jgi:hypothetical protein
MPERPAPPVPAVLTPAERVVWEDVVSMYAPDFFQQKKYLLIQYCRGVVCANEIACEIQSMRDSGQIDVGLQDRLFRMQERESRNISSIEVRMGMAVTTKTNSGKPPGRPLRG